HTSHHSEQDAQERSHHPSAGRTLPGGQSGSPSRDSSSLLLLRVYDLLGFAHQSIAPALQVSVHRLVVDRDHERKEDTQCSENARRDSDEVEELFGCGHLLLLCTEPEVLHPFLELGFLLVVLGLTLTPVVAHAYIEIGSASC